MAAAMGDATELLFQRVSFVRQLSPLRRVAQGTTSSVCFRGGLHHPLQRNMCLVQAAAKEGLGLSFAKSSGVF